MKFINRIHWGYLLSSYLLSIVLNVSGTYIFWSDRATVIHQMAKAYFVTTTLITLLLVAALVKYWFELKSCNYCNK